MDSDTDKDRTTRDTAGLMNDGRRLRRTEKSRKERRRVLDELGEFLGVKVEMEVSPEGRSRQALEAGACLSFP